MGIDSDGLTLTASNLETEIRARLEVTVNQPGSLCLPARQLLSIVKTQPAGTELRLRETPERAVLTAHKSRFQLSRLPAEDFPHLDHDTAGPAFNLPQRTLRQSLIKTLPSMAVGDVRYYLNGLHLALAANTLTVTATDGHRLARSVVTLDLPPPVSLDCILANRAITSLTRLLDASDAPVTLALGERHLSVTLPELVFVTKFVDGRYPDADRVIPRDLPHRATLDRRELLAAAARCNILSNDKYHGLRLTFSDHQLDLSANNQEGDSATDALVIDYAGPEVAIGFNHAYLASLLTVIDAERVTVDLVDHTSASLWRGADQTSETFILMPVRL
jgi:DNA polymerase-3 subunit beta